MNQNTHKKFLLGNDYVPKIVVRESKFRAVEVEQEEFLETKLLKLYERVMVFQLNKSKIAFFFRADRARTH